MFRRLLLIGAFAASTAVHAADPVITEFLASNQTGLKDEDGSFPDWLEIYNPDAAPVNLDGWYLTDKATAKTKWRFPAVTIAPGGYLVVFTDDKNRAVAGSPLHTNFSLSKDGEYLGLIKPDGVTAASEYTPGFPVQFADISYGIPSNVEPVTFVSPTAPVKWTVPSSATSPADTWRDPGFDDSLWTAATQGIGYDRNTAGVNFLTEIGSGGNTESAMYNIRTSVYLRVPFTVPAGSTLLSLKLRVKYDDGFTAHLNGQPLVSSGVPLKKNAPATVVWNSGASKTHEDVDAMIAEEFDVSDSIPQIVGGDNVLAFQVLNQGAGSSDLLFRVELVAEIATPGPAHAPGYFGSPTPGARNGGPSSLVIPQEVTFSKPAGSFTTDFTLTLGGASAGQEIRYTLDGSMPTASSPLYTAPLSIATSRLVRARIRETATGALGFVKGVQYEKLATTLSSYASTGLPFKSSLPVVVLNNRGGGEPPNDDVTREVRMQVYDRDGTGYSTLSAAPVLSTNVGAKIRGSSSASFPKKPYGLEFHDESGQEVSLPLLGMPAAEDWALTPCYDFDRAFMRNAWVYEASRRNGRWAPRTRFVEVFFNQDGDDLEYADYRGVYVLSEVVRRGSDRLDITKIEASDTTAPGVSGGYIVKIDRADPDEFKWTTTRNLPPVTSTTSGLVLYRPKLSDLAPQQSAYLMGYFQKFEDALFTDAAGSFATRNYRNYIDPESWVDHNLFNMFAKNVDALRLSGFFHKDRGRRIEGGVLWDFDRSANSTDSRDNDTNTWRGTGDGTDYFTYAWWQQLFQDIEFRQLYVDRWQKLRRGTLAATEIQAMLDGYLAEFRVGDAEHPAMRDYARWYGSSTSNNLTTEVSNLKTWLTTRATWIDSQFTAPPALSLASGIVTAGQTVTITVPPGTQVHYTTDGSDPRAIGGGFAPGATLYSGAITLPANSITLTARAWRSGTYTTPATNWSGPVSALYLVNETYASFSDLRVSAVHYHPLAPTAAELAVMPDLDASDFEWIELANVSAAPVNLESVRFVTKAPVSPVTLPGWTLAPGGRALVVKNRQAFTLRNGSAAAVKIAAEWPGDKKLDDGGARVQVLDRGGNFIANFEYETLEGWPARANGAGSSLEYLSSSGAPSSYENGANWRASTAVHGSPGSAGAAPVARIAINELLASATSPGGDAIELHNLTGSPVDLGGWFLSDTPSALTETDYRKFRIPNGTILPANGYLAFNETAFNPNGTWNPSAGTPAETEFTLEGHRGGKLWLLSGDPVSGKLADFEDAIGWSPVLEGVSTGRWPDGTGTILPLAAPTLAASNRSPRIGGIQISEIQYHPATGQPEFLELVNVTDATRSLDQWTIGGDVGFRFGPGHSLAPGESLVLVAFDPVVQPLVATAFRTTYGMGAEVKLAGPWSTGATLGNATGVVRLSQPVPPPAEDPSWISAMVEEEADYLSTAPWPAGASGTGASIRRRGIHGFSNDPASWMAATASPGREAGGYAGWARSAPLQQNGQVSQQQDPDGDGVPNLVEYLLGTDPLAGSPATSALEKGAGEEGGWYVEYTRRLDRDDAELDAWESTDLLLWTPVADEEVISSDGLLETRRAWLPEGGKGFLRLKGEQP